MKRKIVASLLLGFVVSITLCGCQNTNTTDTENTQVETPINISEEADDEDMSVSAADELISDTEDEEANADSKEPFSNANMPDSIKYKFAGNREVKFTSYDLYAGYDLAEDTVIKLEDTSVSIAGSGVNVQDNQIILTEAGTYVFQGSLSDGQLCVNAGDDDKVHIVFDNASINCSFSAPIVLLNADKVIFTTTERSTNTIEDYYLYTDDSVNGCIYSKCDISFNGTGTLNVISHYNSGIVSKDNIKIADGTINVEAANNGIKGKDSVCITGGTITVTSKDDGIKSDNKKSEDKGFIYLGGGSISITANDDSLQATNAVIIENCYVYSRCYGNKINCDGQIVGEDIIKDWL